MSVLRAQVVFANDNGLPEDSFVNTWHFGTVNPANDVAVAGFIAGLLEDFYTEALPSGNKILGYMSKAINPAASRIKFYRLNDPKPRVPIYDELHFAGAVTGPDYLPEQVACVLSFQAAKVSGLDQAHRRNRVFIGPLGLAAMQGGGSSQRVGAGFRTDLAQAAQNLLGVSESDATWSWIVYSEALGVGDTAAVDNGWVDDRWDTQRRRTLAPSTRTLWS